MKQISWKDITVEQFQGIYQMSQSTADDMEKAEKVIMTLYGMTKEEIDKLSIAEFNQLSKHCGEVMEGQIPGKPVKEIKIGKHRYSITYQPTKLTHRQYVEILHFGDNPIEQMHLIMASIVQPVTWYGRKLKNDSDNHEDVAADMLKAKVIDVYHSCVFFCKLYINLIETIKPYLIQEMMTKGATMDQAKILVNSSQDVMAGFIIHEKWPYLKI